MPGRYERAADAERAEELHNESLEGVCDDEFNDAAGWHGLLGRHVLHESEDGFFTYDDHPDDADARTAFEARSWARESA